jgi:hypothetical protein
MSRYSSHDPYLDPASGVLKNRFGITDEATLEATEASLVALRSYELTQRPLPGNFDLAHARRRRRERSTGDVHAGVEEADDRPSRHDNIATTAREPGARRAGPARARDAGLPAVCRIARATPPDFTLRGGRRGSSASTPSPPLWSATSTRPRGAGGRGLSSAAAKARRTTEERASGAPPPGLM